MEISMHKSVVYKYLHQNWFSSKLDRIKINVFENFPSLFIYFFPLFFLFDKMKTFEKITFMF